MGAHQIRGHKGSRRARWEPFAIGAHPVRRSDKPRKPPIQRQRAILGQLVQQRIGPEGSKYPDNVPRITHGLRAYSMVKTPVAEILQARRPAMMPCH